MTSFDLVSLSMTFKLRHIMSGLMIVVKLCVFITRDPHCFHHLPFSSQWYDVVDGVGEKSARIVVLIRKFVTRIRPVSVRTIQS